MAKGIPTCGHEDAPYEAKGLCKSCYRTAYYAANRDRERAAAADWASKNPGRAAANLAAWKAANPDAVRRHKRKSYYENAEQKRRESREWRNANLERANARVAAWRKANPERTRELVQAAANRRRTRQRQDADLTLAQWRAILDEFEYRCAYCNVEGVPLQLEHMTPLSRGGRHTASNVVPACQPCNASKHTRTALEFIGPEMEIPHGSPGILRGGGEGS